MVGTVNGARSLTQHFDQHPLASLAVELGVVDLLPGAKIEFAIGDRYQHLMTDQQILQVSVPVVLASTMIFDCRDNWVSSARSSMGGAYIAPFAMYATLDNRTHGKKRPCVRHPGTLYRIRHGRMLAAGEPWSAAA